MGYRVYEYVDAQGDKPWRQWLETLVWLASCGNSGRGRRSMVNRSRDWDEGLARDLQDPVFAREFV
ncbi:MAG: hypothetical protein AAF320_01880, partial [Myxococcota bacterium]